MTTDNLRRLKALIYVRQHLDRLSGSVSGHRLSHQAIMQLTRAYLVQLRNPSPEGSHYTMDELFADMERSGGQMNRKVVYRLNKRLEDAGCVAGRTEGRQYFKARKYYVTVRGQAVIQGLASVFD